MRSGLTWAATAAALLAFSLACSFWALSLASECSTRPEINFRPGLVPFLVYAAAGGWVIWSGTRPQRLLLFAVSALLLVFYIAMMAEVLPMVLSAEISCAEHGLR
jgi:hypothetical protein